MTSTTAWKVVVDRGSHCCMMRVRRWRVSLDLRSRGEILSDRALTILVTESGSLIFSFVADVNLLVSKNGVVHSPYVL